MCPWLSRVTVSPGFVALLTLFVLQGEGAAAAALLTAAAAHEAGHLAALCRFGVPVSALRIGAFGARLETVGRGRLSYGRELCTVLSGPAVNVLCALALAWAAGRFSWPGGFLCAGAHLVLGGFNLLPIPPLDGGRALCLLLSWLLGPDAGERLSAAAGGGALVLLALAGAYVAVRSGGNVWLLVGIAGLIGAFAREMGLVKRRRTG